MGRDKMNIIETLTDNPNQLQTLTLENRETALIRLYYSGRCQAWYFDLSYNTFQLKGCKVTLTPNTLRQFRKILPFGLAFFSDSDIEPYRLDDFSSNRVQMGILSADEVKEIEETVYNA